MNDLVISGVGTAMPAHPVVDDSPWFDYRTELGARGYKYLPSAAQYLLAAARRAFADAGDTLDATSPQRRGAVVGTNSAAIRLSAEMDRTVLAEGADALSPAMAPFFSINVFAGRLAQEHSLQAFNLTLTSPLVASLEAVSVAESSVGLGRADVVVVAATEEALEADEPGAQRSESGAVAVVLESRSKAERAGRRVYGSCRVSTFFVPPQIEDANQAVANRLKLLGPIESLPAVVVLTDETRVGSVLRQAFPEAKVVLAGAGCLAPLAAVAESLTAARECLLVVGHGMGNAALVHVSPEHDGKDRTC